MLYTRSKYTHFETHALSFNNAENRPVVPLNSETVTTLLKIPTLKLWTSVVSAENVAIEPNGDIDWRYLEETRRAVVYIKPTLAREIGLSDYIQRGPWFDAMTMHIFVIRLPFTIDDDVAQYFDDLITATTVALETLIQKMNNENAIKNAYRSAMLHCHPDKNHNNPIIPKRYYDLLNEARDYLDRGGPVEQFRGYPVLFFPRSDNLGQPTLFKIPTSSQFTVCECGEIPAESSTQCNTPSCVQLIKQDFKVCNTCKTPIPVYGYNIHISEHELCSLCKKVADKDHYQVSHPEAMCLLCDAVNLNGHIRSHAIDSCSTCQDKLDEGDDSVLVNHICQDHFACPLCKQECGDNFCKHLSKVHYFGWDESCINCYDEVLSHYLGSHRWFRCPYSECELHIAQGKLWEHAKAEHQFRQCSACARTEEGFSKDRIHAEAHKIANCPACMKLFESYNLPCHQVNEHHWLFCIYCNSAEESEEMLQVHVKEDHRLANCSICQQQHLEEKIDIHLSEDHSWMKCSWCNKAFTEEELRTHITVSHPLQEFCSCGHKDTIPGLKLHRMHTHAWQQCPYCENIEPPDQFEQHIDEHQLMVCQECNISLLPEKERAHFQEKHQYVQCPFCTYFNSLVNMPDHISRHLDQSRLALPAPTLSAKFQGITGQSQEGEPLRRDQLDKRKRSSEKCANCRTRKIKCTFEHSKNTCDQCLGSKITCPGASRTTKRLKNLA